jgi:hypothetical protein
MSYMPMKSYTTKKDDHDGFTYFKRADLNYSHRYKLHINIRDDHYVEYRDRILEVIERQDPHRCIARGKYFNCSRATIESDPRSKECKLIKMGLDVLVSGVPEKVREFYSSQLDGLSARNQTFFRESKDKGITKREYRDSIKNINHAAKSVENFINQKQFTLRLTETLDAKQIMQFCLDVESDLQKMGVVNGDMCNSDLAVTRCISFRQESFNAQPHVYVSGTESEVSKVDTAILEKLKDEARNSDLYKAMMQYMKQQQSIYKTGLTVFTKQDEVPVADVQLTARHVRASSF